MSHNSNVAGNATTVAWVSDPDGRGTVTLLTSCLLTLGLCVWSSMHLDIPRRQYPQIKLLLQYVKWSLLGVFGPELVVYVAWRQLNSARTLRGIVRTALAELEPDEEEGEKSVADTRLEREGEWSDVHGFYAGMGGFVFDFEKGRPLELASCLPDLERLTLTARGVALLAKCGHLPEITRRQIEDKSKSDHLAKTLIILQATWFLIQIVGRLAQHLPVTLLEVNTIAHIFCLFLVYLLWWNKPALIAEPTHLVGDWVPPIAAYMYMSSQISIWERDRPGTARREWLDSELAALAFVKTVPEENNAADGDTTSSEVDPEQAGPLDHGEFRPRQQITSLAGSGPVNDSPLAKSFLKVVNPSHTDYQRWTLAAQAVRQYPAIAARFKRTTSANIGRITLEPETEELVMENSSTWPAEHLLRGTGGKIMGMILWSASIAFGGIQLTAWKIDFPTIAEAWLWRASALWIATSGFIWFTINGLGHYFTWVENLWTDVVKMKANKLMMAFLVTLASICGGAYVFSRGFLVVEAFISIRALPKGAYDTPDWSQLIPHL